MVSQSGRPLHDYVPLYFGFKTPMVVRNKDHNESLVFLRFSLEILSIAGVVFKDGNARSAVTQFFKFTHWDDLKSLHSRAISSVKWAGNEQLKRHKQAEILVPDFLEFEQVLDIIVFSAAARNQVLAKMKNFGTYKRILLNPGCYFTN